MKTLIPIAALLLVLPVSAAAQEKKPVAGEAPKPADAFVAELQKLSDEYEDAEQAFFVEMRAFYEKQAAEMEGEKERGAEEKKDEAKDGEKKDTESKPVKAAKILGPGEGGAPTHPSKAFIPKFQSLATRAKGTDTGVKALVWVASHEFDDGPRDWSKPKPPGAAEAAIADLLANSMKSPALGELCSALRGRAFGDHEASEANLRRIRAESPHKSVKADATAALALVLYEVDGTVVVENDMPQMKPFADDVKKNRSTESLALMNEMKKDFADTKAFGEVEGVLYEMEHLQVGMTAPDVTGPDAEGKTFKLSDYRGKVVALDFWGFW